MTRKSWSYLIPGGKSHIFNPVAKAAGFFVKFAKKILCEFFQYILCKDEKGD